MPTQWSIIIVAFLTSVLLGESFLRTAPGLGFIDLPDHRKIHTAPTPRTGGLAMALGSIITLTIARGLRWLPWPVVPWQTSVAGLGLVLLGGLDDRFSFQPKQKILIMLAFAALAAWPWAASLTGLAAGHWARLAGFIPMVLLLTFWFMAVPNALNIEDAINGYMGGFTFIVLLALRLRGLDTGIPMGAMAGFLVLNWPRARHFMGDAGSFGCGFLIAEEILRAGALDHPLLALVLTAPISLDVAMGLIRRHRLGMSPMAPDRCTCPHHVLSLCNGSPILATPFLLLLTVGFVFAVDRPTLAAGLAILYSGGLVWLNRRHLFLSPVRYHLEVKQERPPERQVDLATGTEILSCEEGTIRESQEVGCGSGLSE